MTHEPLGAGREFDLIRRFWSVLGDRAAPSGDDCALVDLGGTTLAISSDLSIEGTHFHLGWLQAHEVGYRACAAALSDVAAVGGTPLGVLVSLGVPTDMAEQLAADVMDGVGEAVADVSTTVLGGDVVRATALTLDVVAVGRAERPVRRSGAGAGDELWVTGTLGGPHAALAARPA
jgi:thiamine-monophosphate kinase